MLVSTTGIVLRTLPYRDTSLIVQILTRDRGRIGLMARGVRKRPGAPAPFQQGTVTFYHRPARDLQTLKEFAVREARLGLARSLVRYNGAALLTELVLRTVAQDAPEEVYAALDHALDGLDQAPEPRAWPTLLAGAWRLVALLGYGPALDACSRCGRPPESDEVMRFDVSQAAFTCPDCHTGGQGVRIGPLAREQLAAFLAGDADAAPDMAPNHVRPHVGLLGDFLTYHVTGDPPLRSLQALSALLSRDSA